MNTPGRSLLAEGLKEVRAAIGEVRAEIEELESPPLSSAVRERLNLLLEAEQHLHTKIEVLDRRVTPYCDMGILQSLAHHTLLAFQLCVDRAESWPRRRAGSISPQTTIKHYLTVDRSKLASGLKMLEAKLAGKD
jgi:hypothetical protein